MARIIDLIDIASSLADTDVLAVGDVSANQDKKLLVSALKAFLLGGRTLGGSGAGDVTVNNAIQELTNKRMTNPKINSANPTAVTSEDLDKLHAVTVGATQMNYLSGAASNIQTQLDNKAGITSLQYVPRYYTVSFTAASSSYEISEATIRGSVGVGSDRRICAFLMPVCFDRNSSPYLPMGGVVTYSITPAAGGILDKLAYSGLTTGRAYTIMVICFDISLGGGA